MSQIVFAAELDHLHSILEWVKEEVSFVEPTKEWLHELELALEEALVNIIQYAYPSKQKGNIQVSVNIEEEKVRITLKDQGRKFNPLVEAAPPTVTSLDSQKEGGLGLYLMQANVDEVLYHYENQSNVLTLLKSIPMGSF